MKYIGKYTLVGVLTMMNIGMSAQTFHHYSTTDDSRWQKCQDIKAGKAVGKPTITTDAYKPIVIFRNWGTTFNEQDWKAAEHTFHLINHYLGHGCNEYNNWNMVLCDHGESAWGWKQNALVRVNSSDRSYEYVPEWFAYRHYSQFIQNGAKIIGFKPSGDDQSPVLVALTPENKYVIVVGNFSDVNRTHLIGLGDKTLEVSAEPHSFNSYVQK